MTCGAGCSPWFGPERPKWVGPLPYAYPQWLPEEAPGNYGFDPAGLSRDSAKFDRYFELELLHARWAMLGALGAVIPGAIPTSSVRHQQNSAHQPRTCAKQDPALLGCGAIADRWPTALS